MIRLVRPAPPPAFPERAARDLDRLRQTAEEGGFRAQRHFEFRSQIWMGVKEHLVDASLGKCAYCETYVRATGFADVEHHRPKSRAEGLTKGEVHPDHYWWLAYSWDNLLATCRRCDRAKRNRFPVEGPRLEPGEPLERERPLLLDPFGPDDPDEHLLFAEDGTVTPLSTRGACTIDVLTLNRPSLVEARQRVAEEVLFRLRAGGDHDDVVERVTRPDLEYATLRRHLLRQHDAPASVPAAAVDDDVEVVPADLGAVWIEEIDIVSFGCIRRLELRFTAPGAGAEPWIVLLGSNGAGKSTILRAIALTLCSAADRRRLVPDASRYLNRDGRADRGHVRIRFNGGEEVCLEVRRGEHLFTARGRRPHFAIVGYGSTRLLPRRTATGADRAVGPRLTNLFDPWAALADAERWLADPRQVRPDDFKVLATSLKKLMSVEDDVELSRRSGRLHARLFDSRVGLDELSAGYQSILSFALDLSLAFAEAGQGSSTENFEGMVLLDELEAHLHPEWKMRVVSDLRAVFPHLQFVSTTHDPLCLRGLQAGEVHLLQRSAAGVTVEQVDVPPGLDADEILTGEWFGLDTTLDPEVEADLRQYRNLRMQYGPDAPQVQPLLSRLDATLGPYAGTSIGRIMVEAAGDLVAEQAPATTTRLTTEQIKQRLVAHARERLS